MRSYAANEAAFFPVGGATSMRVVLRLALFVMACGSSSGPDAGAAGGGGAGGGSATGGGDSAGTTLPATIAANLSVAGDVFAPATSTIAAGATLTVAPGSVVRFAPGASLVVAGALTVGGTKSSIVEFDSQTRTAVGLWNGLVVAAGGTATLSHLALHHAEVAITTHAGSTWSLSGFRIDTSNSGLAIASAGTAQYGTIHLLGPVQTDTPVHIVNASPSFSDVLFDNASTGVDMIVISGGGAQFDHVEVTQCHCAWHIESGAGIVVTNSSVHDTAHALMNFGAKGTRYQGNNLTQNTVNLGDCSSGGSIVATSNFASPATLFDASCVSQVSVSPAPAPLSGVGPRPEP